MSITQVKKLNNGYQIILLEEDLEISGIKVNDLVEIQAEAGCLSIRLVPRTRSSLEQLLDGVTAQNQQGEISTGHPVGDEVW